MDAIKVQLDRIRQQLAGLTATQRMLVGTLVAVMVLTLLYWGKYAGDPEMVALLNQSLSEDEIGRIDMALQSQGVPHTVSGDKVMVPADRKSQVLADLMFAQVMPRDTHSAFDDMNKDGNPFASPSERDQRYTQAVQSTLAQIIGRFPGVSTARVIINAKSEHRIEESIEASATVFIETRDRAAVSKQLVKAAADGVAGAVSGLKPSKVSVIVNGFSHHVADAGPDSLADSGDLMDLKATGESKAEQKIRDMFYYIPGLTVSVTMNVENSRLTSHEVKYDNANTVSKPVKEESRTEETSTPGAAAADPGAGANTGASIITSATGGTATSTVEENKAENAVFPGSSEISKVTPAGTTTVLSAAVRVPRSYFVAVYKQQNAAAKEPDDNALAVIQKSVLDSVRDGTKKTVGLKSDDDLSVDAYTDPSPVMAMATAASIPAAQLTNVTAHVKEISIGVLALVSMLMMFSMVRKATPAPLVAAAIVDEGPKMLTADEAYAGEAGLGNSTLDGVELDDDAVRTQQMLEQVTTMVKENPDAAASLVKKWLNRS